MIRVFVQARMTSVRLPGKVLAPFRGTTVLGHLLRRLDSVVPAGRIVVATSDDASDNRLASTAREYGVNVFRGALHDVYDRLAACAAAFPCNWFFRVSADSPLLEPSLLSEIAHLADADIDLVTNVQTRTFPRGHSAELLNTATFLSVDRSRLSLDDREHVTPFFYRHAEEFRIANLASSDVTLAAMDLSVDDAADLERLQALSDAAIPTYGFRRQWPANR